MTAVIYSKRRERKKTAIRLKIIATAMELFTRHGLEEVTVEHIADLADLGKGTIYNYFQTKEDIVVAYMVEKEREVQARMAGLNVSTGSLESVLTEYLRLQFRLKRRYHKFVRVFLAQIFRQTEQMAPYMMQMQEPTNQTLQTLFRRLDQRGLLRKDVSLADLTLVFQTMHLGLSALWAVEGPPFRNTERTMRQEIRLFCEGLEAKPKRTKMKDTNR